MVYIVLIIILVLLIGVIGDVSDHAKKAKAQRQFKTEMDELRRLGDQKIKEWSKKVEIWENRMDDLYRKYLSSPLTREIADYLCDDSGVSVTPTKIIVSDSNIRAFYYNKQHNEQCISFNFIEHQIPNFVSPEQNPDLSEIMHGQTFFNLYDQDVSIGLRKMDKILLNPQEAFSKALNTLLSNRYVLSSPNSLAGMTIDYLTKYGVGSDRSTITNDHLALRYSTQIIELSLKPTNNF